MKDCEFEGDHKEEIDGYSSVSSVDPELGKHGFDANKFDEFQAQ